MVSIKYDFGNFFFFHTDIAQFQNIFQKFSV